MEMIAALIAFGLVTATAMLVHGLSPRVPAPSKRKPQVTEYVGPRFTIHGREIVQTGRRVL